MPLTEEQTARLEAIERKLQDLRNDLDAVRHDAGVPRVETPPINFGFVPLGFAPLDTNAIAPGQAAPDPQQPPPPSFEGPPPPPDRPPAPAVKPE